VITILTSLLTLHEKVTVVVACRNENPHIRGLLESLVRLDRSNLALDAIIADGMSTDGTREILEEFRRAHPWCGVLDNTRQIVSNGLNQAILLAGGEFVVRMDAHTVYEPDYVVRCLSVLRANLSHGVVNAGGPQRSRAQGFWQRAIRAGFHSPFATGGARFRDDNYRGPTDTVPYGCWRRDYLIAIGLFDEALVRNQDDELNLRIRLAGGVVWQDPSIVSWYSPRSTLGGLFYQQLQFGFWRVAVLTKHPGTASFRHLIPGASALLGLGLCLMIGLGIERFAAAMVLSALGFVYLVLSLRAALSAASRQGWDLLPALPISFAVYQSAYASGFCAGLAYWSLCRRPLNRLRALRADQANG
jgi:succinoglycan biosynthesis protein ExoA